MGHAPGFLACRSTQVTELVSCAPLQLMHAEDHNTYRAVQRRSKAALPRNLLLLTSAACRQAPRQACIHRTRDSPELKSSSMVCRAGTQSWLEILLIDTFVVVEMCLVSFAHSRLTRSLTSIHSRLTHFSCCAPTMDYYPSSALRVDCNRLPQSVFALGGGKSGSQAVPARRAHHLDIGTARESLSVQT